MPHPLPLGGELASIRQAAELDLTALAWSLAASAQAFYELHGLYDEGVSTHQVALAACRRTGDGLGEAVLLRNLADLWTSRSGADLQDKLDAAEAALALFRRFGKRRGEADALWMCGDVHRVRGLHGPASRLLAEALTVAVGDGHELGECHALTGMAIVSWEQGRPEVTRELAERCAALAGRLGYPRDMSVALTLLGFADPARQESMLRTALTVARDAGDPVQELYTLARLGMHYVTVDRARARGLLDTALARSRADGLLFGEALASWGLGELELADGQPRAAVDHLDRAIRLLGDRRFTYLRARALTALGSAHVRLDPPAAIAAWTGARALFDQIDNRPAVAEVDALLAAPA